MHLCSSYLGQGLSQLTIKKPNKKQKTNPSRGKQCVMCINEENLWRGQKAIQMTNYEKTLEEGSEILLVLRCEQKEGSSDPVLPGRAGTTANN